MAEYISMTANVTNRKPRIRKDGQKLVAWSKIDDVDKILQLIHYDLENALFMNRKHRKKVTFESGKHFTYKMSWKRKQIIADAKLQENSDELVLLCAFIDMSCQEFSHSSRICCHYSFDPSWIEFIQTRILNKEDVMYDNWQDELRKYVTRNFRNNDKLDHAKTGDILDSYHGSIIFHWFKYIQLL